LAYGRPVVASDVGGLRDLAGAAELIPGGDVAAFREAISALLADEGRRQNLGALGRAYAEERLTRLEQARALVAAYRLTAG
jgi:glycosyltransferase involved in cell wall biosynthesis